MCESSCKKGAKFIKEKKSQDLANHDNWMVNDFLYRYKDDGDAVMVHFVNCFVFPFFSLVPFFVFCRYFWPVSARKPFSIIRFIIRFKNFFSVLDLQKKRTRSFEFCLFSLKFYSFLRRNSDLLGNGLRVIAYLLAGKMN